MLAQPLRKSIGQSTGSQILDLLFVGAGAHNATFWSVMLGELNSPGVVLTPMILSVAHQVQ
jgi:hypothetical protein